MATPIRFGSEFLVNTTTSGGQIEPSTTMLTDGRFVVVWSDSSGLLGDASGFGVVGQIFNADGSKSGAEFLVNTGTASTQGSTSITALADGRFAVTWHDTSNTPPDTSGAAIRYQLYNADGTKAGIELQANTATTSNQTDPSIVQLADGRMVIAWEDSSIPALFSEIRFQMFNADGTKSGVELSAVTSASSDQTECKLTALQDGRFVIAWQDVSQTAPDTSAAAIRFQVFNTDGSKFGTEQLANTTTTNAQTDPSIATLANGQFVIAWTDASLLGGDASVSSIKAQVFNSDGSKSGAEFLVNTTTANNQANATTVALQDGRFVVTWEDSSLTGGDASSSAVYAQLFKADGSKDGAEFRVNTTTAGAQDSISATALADGRIVFTWKDASATGGDTSSNAVRAQIYDPRESAVSLFGTTGNDDYVGTYFADSLSGSFGNDKIAGGNGNDVVNGEDGNDTLNGQAGADRVNGGIGNDILRGGAGADRLDGSTGNDTLDGGNEGDVMIGGTGNDFFVIDGADVVSETATGGIDRVQSGLQSLNLGSFANVENALLTGVLSFNLTGSAANNALTGNSGNNTIIGQAGIDTINGGKGADLLTGGTQRDIFKFAAGDSGQAAATLDKVTDVAKGAVGVGDTFDFTAALFRGGTAAAASVNQASINAATGVASFAAGSGATLADALSDVATRFGAGGNTAGEFAFFRVNGAGAMHLFISDGTAGVTANDVLVKFTNLGTISSIDLTAGNLTILT